MNLSELSLIEREKLFKTLRISITYHNNAAKGHIELTMPKLTMWIFLCLILVKYRKNWIICFLD